MADKVQKIKECMFTKDYYTDEDRKSLCDGCKEECKFNEKEYSVNNGLDLGCSVIWRDDDLEKAAKENAKIERSDDIEVGYDINRFGGFVDGANWHKEQMLTKAVDATVHIDAGGYPYIPQMELYDYDKDMPLAKEGEKVKVIVIKED